MAIIRRSSILSVSANLGLRSRPDRPVGIYVDTCAPMDDGTTVGVKQNRIFLRRGSHLEVAATKISHPHLHLPAGRTGVGAFACQARARQPPSFCPIRDVEHYRLPMPCSVPQAAVRLH